MVVAASNSLYEEVQWFYDNWTSLTITERAAAQRLLDQCTKGRLNHYITDYQPPQPKQCLVLCNDELEVFYGGAAGGGKSSLLFMAALQYVDQPNYAALLLRKSYADFLLPGALMDRSHKWLENTDAVWSGRDYRWTFPSGATISFGYLQHENDLGRYKSSEFQYIGFDELSEFEERDYTFMYSRLRKAPGSKIPLRIRAASNPGGKGHEWTKKRFIPKEFSELPEEEKFDRIYRIEEVVDGKLEERTFIPSRIEDNPTGIDLETYDPNLRKLGPARYNQLRRGDWDAIENGEYFKREWFRYFKTIGGVHYLHKDNGKKIIVAPQDLDIIHVADTASTVKKTSAYTVVMTIGIHRPTYNMLILDVWRDKVEVPVIGPYIVRSHERWNGEYAVVENKENGIGIIQWLRGPGGRGITVKDFNPGSKDPVSRSTVAQIRMEAEQIWFPEQAPWLLNLENELLEFPGVYIDQVVVVSMAAVHIQDRERGRSNEMPGVHKTSGNTFMGRRR